VKIQLLTFCEKIVEVPEHLTGENTKGALADFIEFELTKFQIGMHQVLSARARVYPE
jgi:hypothetical protein